MPVKYEWAECKGCGKTIIFAKTPQGKTIPLDPHAPIYQVSPGKDGALQAIRILSARPSPENFTGFQEGFAVSHFATCPKASDFSHKK